MPKYRSRFEARCAKELRGYDYETVKLPYTIVHNYTPDFVDLPTKTIVETKGLFLPADRTKMLAVKAQHPDWRIIFIFQNEKLLIRKGSRITYKQWALNNGFEVLPQKGK